MVSVLPEGLESSSEPLLFCVLSFFSRIVAVGVIIVVVVVVNGGSVFGGLVVFIIVGVIVVGVGVSCGGLNALHPRD